MKLRTALTLVELMLVLGLIAIVSIPSVLAVQNFRNNQALPSAADKLSVVLQRAHIYARETKGGMVWGVERVDENTYRLLSRRGVDVNVEAEYDLDGPVVFENPNFSVWFAPVNGGLISPINIILKGNSERRYQVGINAAGSVETKEL